MPKLVSIVTPSYNQGRFLEETIRSVLEQTYPFIEYIVIDGGSKDESVKIIQKYASRIKYWHSRPDGGQTDAIFQGFAQSTGEILAWLNSDDLLAPDAVEQAVSALEKRSQAVMVYGNRVCIDEHGRLLYFRPSLPFLSRTPYIAITVPQETCFWRREAHFKVGGINRELKFSCDYELFSRLTLFGEIFYDAGLWGFFRKHSTSKTMTLYQTVGLTETAATQEKLWGGRVAPFKWTIVRAFFRLCSICAMLWLRRPAWPACLPAAHKQSLCRRIYGSLHEGSMLKRALKLFGAAGG
jgi:glycosyltransferase involved in cell wall biosynthesis